MTDWSWVEAAEGNHYSQGQFIYGDGHEAYPDQASKYEWVQVAVMLKRPDKEAQVIILRAELSSISKFYLGWDFEMEETEILTNYGPTQYVPLGPPHLKDLTLKIMDAKMVDPK